MLKGQDMILAISMLKNILLLLTKSQDYQLK